MKPQKIKLVNLTPHAIKITGYGVLEPSGMAARAHNHLSQIGDVNGIPLMISNFSGVSNLPEPIEGVMYVVPAYVREALPKRTDLASPAKFLRDATGNIIGCGAFEVNNPTK